MESDFEIDAPGTLRVRSTSEGFHQIKTPAGFSDLAFRNSVATCYTLFVSTGKLPSIPEMHRYWPKISEKVWAELVLTDEFKQALSYRGVDWEASRGLSIQQNMVLLKLSDPTDRRATGTKLKALGIPYPTYQAWMRQELFATSLRQMSENTLKDAIPAALTKLAGNMEAGDQRAIEKVLEISGRYNPAQQQLEDAKAVVLRVIESVIRHVQDPDIRRAILSDIESESIGFAVTNRRALEG